MQIICSKFRLSIWENLLKDKTPVFSAFPQMMSLFVINNVIGDLIVVIKTT